MERKVWIDAIEQSPTAGYITNFRILAESMHVRENADLEGLSAKDLRILAILLLNGLRDHPAGKLLHQLSGKRVLDRFWLVNAATPLPLLKSLLSGAIDQVDDEDLWKRVKRFITKICPPISHIGGFVANSSEHRKDVYHLMRKELGQIHVDIPHLLQAFFPHHVDGPKRPSKSFFKKYKCGRTPRYKDDTWTDWPASAFEKEVFRWLKRFCKRLRKFARRSRPDICHQRRLLGTRSKSIDDYSVMRKERKELNVGFIDASYPKHGSKDRQHPWPQILVPGVLNCDPAADSTGEAWHDLAMCAGKVLLA